MSQTGTVEPLPGGRYRVRFRVGGRLRTLDTFASHAEAEAYRAHWAKSLGDLDPERDVSLADFGERALTRRELRGKISDTDSDWSRFRSHVEGDRIGRSPVRSLTRHDVQEWLERLEGKKLAEQTIRNCRSMLSAICEAAIRARLLAENPTRGFRREPEKRTEEPWTYLTPEEQARLIAVADDEGIGEIIEFAIGSGLRAGEQCALRLVDVHLDESDPHLVVRYGGPPTTEHPKGAPPKWGRLRRVQIFGVAKRALERWMPKLDGLKNPHRLVFPRLGGGRWDAGGFRDPAHVVPWSVWKGTPERIDGRSGRRIPARPGLLERAGIKRDVRWHDLRHTCGSSLVSGWWGRRWELIEVRDLLGHRDIATTQRYAQLGETAAKKAGREAELMFQRVFHAAPESGASSTDSSTISRGATLGDRTPDLRFTKPSNIVTITSTCDGLEQSWNTTARALLEAVAAGDAARVHRLGRELADAVLDSPDVSLALRARTGDVAAAIELAERMAAQATAVVAARRAT